MTGVRYIREDESLLSRGTGFNEFWVTIRLFVKPSMKGLVGLSSVAIVDLQTLCWRIPFQYDKLSQVYDEWKLGNVRGNVRRDLVVVFETWVPILALLLRNCNLGSAINFEPLSSIKGKLYKMKKTNRDIMKVSHYAYKTHSTVCGTKWGLSQC